jgi:hypothetical protein
MNRLINPSVPQIPCLVVLDITENSSVAKVAGTGKSAKKLYQGKKQ